MQDKPVNVVESKQAVGTPPNWIIGFPFLGELPQLTARQWLVLELVTLLAMLGNYSAILRQYALPQIRADLGIGEAEVSGLIALIEWGALPALLLMMVADRIGRRKLMIFSAFGIALSTGVTAFAVTPQMFVVCQFLAVTFLTTEALLAGVFIVEEFPAAVRGWGIGTRLLIGGFGVVIASLGFSVINMLPFGWRALYFLGFATLFIARRMQRHLPETHHFDARLGEAKQGFNTSIVRPLVNLLRAYPSRFFILGLIVFLLSFGLKAAFFYDPSYLQEARGWAPWQLSALTIGLGFTAVASSAYIGRYTDRVGRKRLATVFLIGLPLFIFGFYQVSGFLLPILWLGMIFCARGMDIAMDTFNVELFPTSYRSTANGALAVIGTIGGVLSLTAHDQLFNYFGSQWTAAGVLSLVVLAAPLMVLFLPETSGRTLEELSPEK